MAAADVVIATSLRLYASPSVLLGSALLYRGPLHGLPSAPGVYTVYSDCPTLRPKQGKLPSFGLATSVILAFAWYFQPRLSAS